MFEIESGRTPTGGPLRIGYDENEFPQFSYLGYAIMSNIQVCYKSLKFICTGTMYMHAQSEMVVFFLIDTSHIPMSRPLHFGYDMHFYNIFYLPIYNAFQK